MRSVRASRNYTVFLPALLAGGTLALIVIFPGQSLKAALTGVSIWWEVLFPSLFPFFVVSELMLGFGIVHFFGTLLDPLMRPVFRLPGPGGFVMAMGFASGYPVGARLTAQLRDAQLLNRDESERLAAFTTTADPIFLIGAVSVGFFRDAALAPLLALAHYGGAVVLGILLRFRKRSPLSDTPEARDIPPAGSAAPGLLARAFREMHAARTGDGRPFGRLLLDGIRSGLRLIVVVGALVVFFSVVIQVFTIAHIIPALQSIVGSVLALLGIPSPLSSAVVNGLFEVTLGARAAGTSSPGIPLQAQVAVASFGLAWAGLSVHAQIMSIVSHTQIRYAGFAGAKFVQGILAALIAYFSWPWLAPGRQGTAAAWASAAEAASGWSAAAAYAPAAAALFAAAIAAIAALFALRIVVRFALRMGRFALQQLVRRIR